MLNNKNTQKHTTARNHPVHIHLIKVAISSVSNRWEQRSDFLWTARSLSTQKR